MSETALKLVAGIGIGSRAWELDPDINPNDYLALAEETGIVAALKERGGFAEGEGLVGDAWMGVTEADGHLLNQDPSVIAWTEIPPARDRLRGIEVEDCEQGTVFRREVSRAEVEATFGGLSLLAWVGEKLVVEHSVYVEHGATADGGALVAKGTCLLAITASERALVLPREGLNRADVERVLYGLLAKGQDEALRAAVYEAEEALERWLDESEED